MALTSYADLQAAVSTWSARSDITLPQIQEFIGMAEAKASQVLRVPAMESAKEISAVDGRLKIPQDFMELRSITMGDAMDEPQACRYVSMDQFMKLRHNQNVVDDFVHFTRQGPYWYIASKVADGTNFTCYYYAGIEALSAQNPVNWLLQMSPQAYLWGTLWYLYEYTFDEERANYWKAKFVEELNNIQMIADQAEYRGSILQVGPLS